MDTHDCFPPFQIHFSTHFHLTTSMVSQRAPNRGTILVCETLHNDHRKPEQYKRRLALKSRIVRFQKLPE